MKSNLRRLFMAAALAAAIPGCDYFTDVSVPASDTASPSAYAGVWRSGDYHAISLNSNPGLSYRVASLDDYYIFFGAGIDTGGTRRVTIQGEVQRVCTNGSVAQQQTFKQFPIVRTQPGSPGSIVSNGLWDGPYMRLRDYANCNPGYSLSWVGYRWHTFTEDFAGNGRSHGAATAYWTP